LSVIRRLLEQTRLNPEGCLLLEVGFQQARRVAEMMEISGYREVRVVEDFDGIERVVGGRR
jgi:release factor glutamine methyltransferase